jgi:hypothetical protein
MRTIFLLLLLLPLQLLSQNGSIELTKTRTGRIININEGSRVRIIDNKGSHYGRIRILDPETIILRKDTIALTDMIMIQRRQVSKAILTGVLIFFGEISAVLSIPLLFSGYQTAAVITASAGITAIPYGIIISPSGNNHNRKRWSYKIIDN